MGGVSLGSSSDRDAALVCHLIRTMLPAGRRNVKLEATNMFFEKRLKQAF